MKFKSYIQEEAEEVAEKMVETGETIRSLREGGDFLFVSIDPDKIVPFSYIKLGKKVFYIGQKKPDMEKLEREYRGLLEKKRLKSLNK